MQSYIAALHECESHRTNTNVSNCFDILLTVHLIIILVTDQLNAQILVL